MSVFPADFGDRTVVSLGPFQREDVDLHLPGQHNQKDHGRGGDSGEHVFSGSVQEQERHDIEDALSVLPALPAGTKVKWYVARSQEEMRSIHERLAPKGTQLPSNFLILGATFKKGSDSHVVLMDKKTAMENYEGVGSDRSGRSALVGKERYLSVIAAHEYGHAWDNANGRPSTSTKMFSFWLDTPMDKLPSKYAGTNSSELFAETFALSYVAERSSRKDNIRGAYAGILSSVSGIASTSSGTSVKLAILGIEFPLSARQFIEINDAYIQGYPLLSWDTLALSRPPVERFIDLEALNRGMDDGEKAIVAATIRVQARQVDKLIEVGRKLVERRDPSGLDKVSVPFKGEVQAAIKAELLKLYGQGQEAVLRELRAQGDPTIELHLPGEHSQKTHGGQGGGESTRDEDFPEPDSYGTGLSLGQAGKTKVTAGRFGDMNGREYDLGPHEVIAVRASTSTEKGGPGAFWFAGRNAGDAVAAAGSFVLDEIRKGKTATMMVARVSASKAGYNPKLLGSRTYTEIDQPNVVRERDIIERVSLRPENTHLGRAWFEPKTQKMSNAPVDAVHLSTFDIAEQPTILDYFAEKARALSNVFADRLRAVFTFNILSQIRLGQPFDEQTLRAELGRTSETEARRAAGNTVSEALNLGRHNAAERLGDRIEKAVYSSVLDTASCSACRSADGREVEVGSAEYRRLEPPYRECRGGPRCRCIYAYVLANESPATVGTDWDQAHLHLPGQHNQKTHGIGGSGGKDDLDLNEGDILYGSMLSWGRLPVKDLVWLHLPGQHDQKDHGRGGGLDPEVALGHISREQFTEQEIKGVGDYQGHSSARINNTLRRASADDLADFDVVTVKRLDSAIDKSVTRGPLVVYRGLDMTKAAGGPLRVGDEFTDHGYSSTSLNTAKTEDFGPDTMHISIPAGTKALPVHRISSLVPDEEEVILPRGSRFRVVQVRDKGHDVRDYEVDLL